MRKCGVVGWGAFFHPFGSFLCSCVCDKVQKVEVPIRKLTWEPVQGYGRDCELLIGFFVDRFDGFYPLPVSTSKIFKLRRTRC